MKARELFHRYAAERKTAAFPGYRLDFVVGLTRHTPIAPHLDGIVMFSELTAYSIEKAIREQVEYFSSIDRNFEWKWHEFDTPADLMARLHRHGFDPGDTEALMVYAVDRHSSSSLDSGVRYERVTGPAGIRDVTSVQAKVWGEELTWLEPSLCALLSRSAIFCAYDGEKPVATGWIEFPTGSDFAELHGGAVLSEYRGRSIYSALFDLRVEEAKRRSVEFLAVDAAPMSRPILLQKGFLHVCETIPFRKIRANKAPEPTPGSVTPRAIELGSK